MTISELTGIIRNTDRYNFHSHTEFCDGRAPMAAMAEAAADNGFEVWGISPHSPICLDSTCNMSKEDMETYLATASRLKEEYEGEMKILTSLEIDYISRDFGPHIDYFQKLPLDYRLASVHFVPNQDGVWLDCDGRFERFAGYLKEGYAGDLRYVVEKYFEQVIRMLELGGFGILGHFDKIAGNAAIADPQIEDNSWYEALVDDVISHAQSSGVIVEINTKSYPDKNRFFPAVRWWEKLHEAGVPLAVNSDAHYPEKTDTGRPEAFATLKALKDRREAKSR